MEKCNNNPICFPTLPFLVYVHEDELFLIELYRQYQATKYVVNLQRKGFLRVHLLYFFRLIKMILRVICNAVLGFLKKIIKK